MIRGITISLVVFGLLFFAVPVCCYLFLPNTPQGRFRWATGIELPQGTMLVNEDSDYTVGMRDSFASEGTSLLVFQVEPETTTKIINLPAPWNATWERGAVPLSINSHLPKGDAIFMAKTGDSGDGHMLAVDTENDQIWLRVITIRCTRSRGPRGFFCLQVNRRGPVIVDVITLNPQDKNPSCDTLQSHLMIQTFHA